MKKLALGLLLLMGGLTLPGCEREVAEIETPEGGVEVDRELDGDLDVETD